MPETDAIKAFTDDRFDGRYTALVKCDPWDTHDPIPYLVTIIDNETGDKEIAYWRGSEDECEAELTRWVDSIEAENV
jgi:hypothetical protein